MSARHVYRNRADDQRSPNELYFCSACNGFYGVPHTGNHCRTSARIARWRPEHCACRFCREESGQPIEGSHGYFLAPQEETAP